MSAGQIAFNVVSLLIAGLLVVSALGILFLVMPGSPPDSRGIWYFTISVEFIATLAIGSGGIANFARDRLSSWPTAIMIGGCCITIWLLPLAIWRIVLLRGSLNQASDRSINETLA